MGRVASQMELLIYMLIIYIVIMIGIVWYQVVQQRLVREQINGLANNTLEMTPEEFAEMRSKIFGGRGRPRYSNQFNFAGVYILLNKSKDRYYVGQGKQVLDRVNPYFIGRGNGDVYADYKYGDEWTIKMIALDGSGFRTLNKLE